MNLVNDSEIEELLLANVPIDIYKVGIRQAHSHILEYELEYDLLELIERYNFDLSLIDTAVLEGLRKVGGGNLYALPSLVNNVRLYYNPDIFDRFGEEYPLGEMTWEELIQLASRLTLEEDGKQFRGLIVDYGFYFRHNQLSAPFVDSKTDEVQFMNDEWQQIVDNLATIYQLPGYEDIVGESPAYQYNELWRGEQTVAMAIAPFLISHEWLEWGISYDIGVMPTFEKRPGVGSQPIPDFNGVASISQHKDEAFQVLAYLHSPQFQNQWARNGVGVALAIRKCEKRSVKMRLRSKGRMSTIFTQMNTHLCTS